MSTSKFEAETVAAVGLEDAEEGEAEVFLLGFVHRYFRILIFDF
jgi:hypothetical protein